MNRKYESLEMSAEAHFLVGDCPECGVPRYTWEKSIGEWHCPKCKSVFADPSSRASDTMLKSTELKPSTTFDDSPDSIGEDDDSQTSVETEEPEISTEEVDTVEDDDIIQEGYFDKRLANENDEASGFVKDTKTLGDSDLERTRQKEAFSGYAADAIDPFDMEVSHSTLDDTFSKIKDKTPLLAVADSLKGVINVFFPELKSEYLRALSSGDEDSLKMIIRSIDHEVLSAPEDFDEKTIATLRYIRESVKVREAESADPESFLKNPSDLGACIRDIKAGGDGEEFLKDPHDKGAFLQAMKKRQQERVSAKRKRPSVREASEEDFDGVSQFEKPTHPTKLAKDELTKLGITINKRDGEYRVNYKGGKEATAYYTTDIEDAIGTGRAMLKDRRSTEQTLRTSSDEVRRVREVLVPGDLDDDWDEGYGLENDEEDFDDTEDQFFDTPVLGLGIRGPAVDIIANWCKKRGMSPDEVSLASIIDLLNVASDPEEIEIVATAMAERDQDFEDGYLEESSTKSKVTRTVTEAFDSSNASEMIAEIWKSLGKSLTFLGIYKENLANLDVKTLKAALNFLHRGDEEAAIDCIDEIIMSFPENDDDNTLTESYENWGSFDPPEPPDRIKCSTCGEWHENSSGDACSNLRCGEWTCYKCGTRHKKQWLCPSCAEDAIQRDKEDEAEEE